MSESSPHAGVIVPMVTPFTPGGAIDQPAVGRLIDFLASHGMHGIFVLGTTGEGLSVSQVQRLAMVTAAAAALRDSTARFYVSVTANCLADSVEMARRYLPIAQAAKATIAAFVAHAPFHFPLTAHDITCYFKALADQLPLPLMLYNIPKTTHLSIPLESIAALVQHPNIVGIKESGDSQSRLLDLLAIARQRPGFDVLVGNTSLATEGLKRGAVGVVVAGANLDPALWSRWWRAILAAQQTNEWAPLGQLQKELNANTALYSQGPHLGNSLAKLKSLLARQNLCGPAMLPPVYADISAESNG